MQVDAIAEYVTLPRMFFFNAGRFADRPLLSWRDGGDYESMTWTEVETAVREVAAGLIAGGVKRGDRVVIVSYNRPEWLIADLAILSAGAITVPIYHTSTRSQAERILERSGSKVAFAARSEKADFLISCSPDLDHIIALDPLFPESPGACAMDYTALRNLGARALADGTDTELENRLRSTASGDCATIIFTSGTTGEPKGVMLSHANILANAAASLAVQPVGPDDQYLSFLPLSHVLERTIGQFLMLMAGVSIAYAGSIRTVADDIPDVRPTVMVSVPRFFEKLHARINDAVSKAPAIRRAIFHWALGVGRKKNAVLLSGRKPGLGLRSSYRIAEKLVFSRFRERLGGRLRFFVSGGAPLAAEITHFFLAAGIQILEGYGLTETSPVISVNRLDLIRPGTVGSALPGVEIKIAEEGEIAARGPSIMLGYYQNEEATAEVIKNGWMYTGDLGQLDDGYLTITGRKKDIIVTSGGKNVSPQPIENMIVEDNLVSQVMVYGDRKKYLTALVVPDYERLSDMASDLGLGELSEDDRTPVKLAENPKVYELLMDKITGRTSELASYQKIKSIAILPEELTEEKGELTPTMKIKKKVVTEKYKSLLDALYDD